MTKIKIFKDPVATDGGNDEKRKQIYNDESENVDNCDGTQKDKEKPVEWERCKENIQPIVQGRQFDTLISSLKHIPSTKDRKMIIDERKEQFEQDLKSVDGNLSDELDLWCEYINWLEQNIPDGGKVNELSSVIENCIERFHDKKELKQDIRLFNVFMKFRRFCDQPIELFHFMYANAICTLHAELYVRWSYHCELLRSFKRAEDLLKLGLKNLASPRELLEDASEQLKYRINIMISQGDMLDVNTTARSSAGLARTLQALKVQVSKNSGEVKVPINRISASMGAPSGGLKSQAPKPKQAQSNCNSRIVGSNSRTTATNSRRPQQIPTQIFADQEITGYPQIAGPNSRANNNNNNNNNRLAYISENDDAENRNVNRGLVNRVVNDENGFQEQVTLDELRAARRVNQIARRVPTSQQINVLGRVGDENTTNVQARATLGLRR